VSTTGLRSQRIPSNGFNVLGRFFDHFPDVAIRTKYALLANRDAPRKGGVMSVLVRSSVTAGFALAGAAFWLAALPDAPTAHAAPELVLTSVDAPLAPPLAGGTT
jgi:hypothetical protein